MAKTSPGPRKGGKTAEQLRAERRAQARGEGRSAAYSALSYIASHARIDEKAADAPTAGGLAFVTDRGRIVVDAYRDADPEDWAWVFTHLWLHLGLGHLDPDQLAAAGLGDSETQIDEAYAAACCVVVHRFVEHLQIGAPAPHIPELPGGDELALTRRWRVEGVPTQFRGLGCNATAPCMRREPLPLLDLGTAPPDWPALFAKGLREEAATALRQTAKAHRERRHQQWMGPWDRALTWFVSSYPLLGALASGLTLVADQEIADAWNIAIAATSADHGEIYINPRADLTQDEWRFVLAHEMLHAALRHDRRQDGRDPYLFNVACDFVINSWLVEMNVGTMPEGLLYDPRLSGVSAESVYDTLVTDLRRSRKLQTPGAHGFGDILGDWLSEPAAAARRSSRRIHPPTPLPWQRTDRVGSVDLDAFYRRALTTGLAYHTTDRGCLPAGLVEEIRALEHPPLTWDAKLARWFDEYVKSPQTIRSYARASRRQASSPDIPRPGRIRPEDIERRCTFGVVLDTSGSMDTTLLGKALGAITSYATARDVPAARVVFCDSTLYDAGYLPVESIAERVRLRSRGGTILQPAIRLLEQALDFPADGAILIITDGRCDILRVRREHAFLIPTGARLPFTPHGPVFHVR
ncbi:vWA domain-containing protein [Streptomyces chartreusis]|uniref:vWA domain-containing protein n=1 Tax=Streptomyces chartreusis TaxID=1969 RepID=UPI0037F2195A